MYRRIELYLYDFALNEIYILLMPELEKGFLNRYYKPLSVIQCYK